MAAISTPTAVSWEARLSVSSQVALIGVVSILATFALSTVIADPLGGIAAQVGSGYGGTEVALAILAPLGWMLFAVSVWTALQDKVGPRRLGAVMRAVALGIVPWIVLTAVALAWTGGPQAEMITIAAWSVGIGAVFPVVAVRTTRR